MGRQLIFTNGVGNKIFLSKLVESIFQGLSVIAHSNLVYNVIKETGMRFQFCCA
jgi:stress-induced morphogen